MFQTKLKSLTKFKKLKTAFIYQGDIKKKLHYIFYLNGLLILNKKKEKKLVDFQSINFQLKNKL